MARPITLPAVAALSIAGIACGVYLGHSAVAEIDPAYFDRPQEARFFADLVPGGYQPSAAVPMSRPDSLPDWAGCSDCPLPSEGTLDSGRFGDAEAIFAVADAEDGDWSGGTIHVQSAAMPPAAPAEIRVYTPDFVRPYLEYPVTVEEARAAAEDRERSAERRTERRGRDPAPLYAERPSPRLPPEREREPQPIGM